MRLLPVAALVAACLAGCAAPIPGTPTAAAGDAPRTSAPVVPSPAPGVLGARFADSRGRFRVAGPTGWRTDTSGAQGVAVLFVAPTAARSAAGTYSPNVSVYLVDSPNPLDATVTGARQELRGLAAYAPMADEALTLADGTPAHLLGGTFTDLSSGLTLRNLQLFTVHDGHAFAVTGTTLSTDWGGHEEQLRAALASLTFAS